MKKLLVPILILSNVFTFSALLWGCGSQCPTQASCPQNAFDPTINYMLPLSTCTDLIGNFRDRQWKANNAKLAATIGHATDIDSRSVWFSLSVLKGFIFQIESQAATNYAGCCDTLGIRFYFATYPDQNNFQEPTILAKDGSTIPNPLYQLPNDYGYKQTLLMIPTLLSNSINSDFDPFIPPVSSTICLPKLAYNATTGSILALAVTAKNHGHIIPPPFHCDDVNDPSYWNRGPFLMKYTDQPPVSVYTSGSCPE